MNTNLLVSLSQVDKNIYLVNSSSRRELGMLFLRYQEYYESPNVNIRGKSFTLVEHQYFYAQDMKKKNNSFTYLDDWVGYNIPAYIIKEVHDLGIQDKNHYDNIMIGLHNMIKMYSNGEPSYLIGCLSEDKDTIQHELAHARFFTNKEYKDKVTEAIEKSPLFNELCQAIIDKGYCKEVCIDEINAFLKCRDKIIETNTPSSFNELEGLIKKLVYIYYTMFSV